MASVRVRGRNGVYYALWWVPCAPRDGDTGRKGRARKLMQRPTGETDRKKAMAIAERWEQESRRPASEMTMDQVRRVMADLYRQANGRDADLQMTPRAFGERWLRGKKADGVASSTLTFYTSSIKQFCAHLDRAGLGKRQLFEITPAMITDFRDALSEQVSKTTANHHLKALKMFFKAARIEGWNPDDPSERVKLIKVRRIEKQKAQPFSIEQVKRVLEICDDEWKSIVRIAFYTGKRLVDIALLMESQVDVLKRAITWHIQKTDAFERSPIHPALLDELMKREWSDGADRPMHPRSHELVKKATGTSRTSALSKQFEHILIRAGLREAKAGAASMEPGEKTRRRPRAMYSFHSLRHTLTTNLASASVDKRIAMELVGHDSEDVHDGYTHLPFELLAAGIEKLPSI